jgi:hypothetical protein
VKSLTTIRAGVIAITALLMLATSTNYFIPLASGQRGSDIQPPAASPGEPRQTGPTLDDRFAAIARVVPSFGGFFIRDRQLHVYLTNTSDLPAAMQAIVAVFGRERLPLDRPVALEGRYNFLQLKGWHDLHRFKTLAIPGASSVDIDEENNRLQIGVLNNSALNDVKHALEQLGIPAQAFNVSLVPAAALTSGRPATVARATTAAAVQDPLTLQSQWRPVAGGIQIKSGGGICTLGFLAVRNKEAGFITCSHCTATQGGVEDTVINQPTTGKKNRIGVETVDPAYFSGNGCPSNRKCRYSDTAFIRRDSTTDQTIPLTPGDFGFLLIPDVTTVDMAVPLLYPVFERQIRWVAGESVSGEVLEKVGRSTGRTAGTVNGTCVDTNVVDKVNGQDVDTKLTMLCQDKFSAIAAPGDSGSPVFKLETLPGDSTGARLYGIAWSSNGQDTWFSPISQVTYGGEMGTLNVRESENPNSKPEIKILQPLDGATVGMGGMNYTTLTAAAVDYEDKSLTLNWSTLEDGPIGSGASLPYIFPTTGLRHLTVSTTDSDGNKASHTITITAAKNTPPTFTIESPVANAVIFKGFSTNFIGKAYDPNEPGETLPCDSLYWSYIKIYNVSFPVFVGNGCNIPLVKFPSTGDYQITVSGTDSLGAKGSAHTTVKVVEPGSPIAEILKPVDSALYADQAVMLTGTAWDTDSNNPLSYKWEVVVGGVHTTLKIGTTQANQQFTREFKPSLYFAPLTCGTKKATIVLTVTDSSGIKFEVSREYYILFGPC